MSTVAADAKKAKGKLGPRYFVCEWPVRLWHWVLVIAIVVLSVTGWLIQNPGASNPGEASDHFSMGYMRFIHFAAGYVLGAAFLGRVYWAIVGNEYARQMFVLPIFRRSWWAGMGHQALEYAFLTKGPPRKWIYHNPLSQASMFLFMLLLVFTMATGFALYGEGMGRGSWADWAFGWISPWFGQSQGVRTWHTIGMWLIIGFTIIHIYKVLREEILSRQTMISVMISGERIFKDDLPD